MSEEDKGQEAPDTSKIESEARVFGWVPLEEFRGGEDKWVDAETFVKRGKEINPILKKNNELLLKKLNAKDAEIEEVRKVAKEFREFQKQQFADKVAKYDEQLAELKAKKKQAITDNEGDLVVEIEDAIDDVKGKKQAAKVEAEKEIEEVGTKSESKIDPVLEQWINDNEWFGKDKRLTRIANSLGEDIREDYPDLKGKEFLDKLSEELEKEFPEKFEKKGKPRSPVESGGNKPPRPRANAHSYENLPPEAKAACDRYVAQKLLTREQYVNDYDWS